MYRVLYSDDSKPSDSFFERAKIDDFDVVWERDWESASRRLKKEIKQFDAVILDAKGKLKPDSKDEDGRHLRVAQSDIAELMRLGEDICAVIYSGNADVAEMFEDESFPLVEKKYGARKLFEVLKNHIESKPLLRVKKRHPIPFRVFNDDLLDPKYQKDLFTLIKSVEKPREIDAPKHLFYNPIRTLLEGVFDCLINYGALPKEFNTYQSNVNLANCRKLLNGKKIKIPNVGSWQLKKNVVPLRIPVHIDIMIEVTNPESHYHKGVSTKYIHYSVGGLVYLLLDVLSWLHECHAGGILSKKLYLVVSETKKEPPSFQSSNITMQFEGKLEIREGQDYGFICKGEGEYDSCFFRPEFIKDNDLISGQHLKVTTTMGKNSSGKPRIEACKVLKKS